MKKDARIGELEEDLREVLSSLMKCEDAFKAYGALSGYSYLKSRGGYLKSINVAVTEAARAKEKTNEPQT